jgi:RNA polymerase sigma-70 factor (ECF subfamily)
MKESAEQDARYAQAAAEFGAALARLAKAAEADPERRRDLLQDMHVALWRSFALYDARCAMRTWIYRVAHNVAASHIDKEKRANRAHVTIEEIEHLPDAQSMSAELEAGDAVARLNLLVRSLDQPDRQVILLYLEGLDAASIGEIVGFTAGAVATRISRLKLRLAGMLRESAHV